MCVSSFLEEAFLQVWHISATALEKDMSTIVFRSALFSRQKFGQKTTAPRF